MDQSDDVRGTQYNERLYFYSLSRRCDGLGWEEDGFGISLGVLEPCYDAVDVSADLGKYRYLLLPITKVSVLEEAETKGKLVPIVGQVQDVFLCADCDFLEDLLAGVLADMVLYHYTVGLFIVSMVLERLLSDQENVPPGG